MVPISDLTQKQWIKACKKLGLEIDKKSGKGSHVRVYPPSQALRPMTIPYHTHKMMSISLYKKLLEWGFEENEIDSALK